MRTQLISNASSFLLIPYPFNLPLAGAMRTRRCSRLGSPSTSSLYSCSNATALSILSFHLYLPLSPSFPIRLDRFTNSFTRQSQSDVTFGLSANLGHARVKEGCDKNCSLSVSSLTQMVYISHFARFINFLLCFLRLRRDSRPR